MSGFMKTVLKTGPSLTLYKKLHRPFNSIIHRQSVNTQPTHPPFLCLAGWCLDSQLAGQCLARALLQRKSAFLRHEQLLGKKKEH